MRPRRAAEAMAMARRVADSDAAVFFVDRDCHPQTLAVLKTRARPLGIEVAIGDAEGEIPDRRVFGVLLQYPGSSGQVRDLEPVIAAAHAQQAIAVVAADS